MDFSTCAPNVDPALMRQVVRVESGGNPYAIGVVGGRLERQPKTLAEAVATAKELERSGFNYSIGTGQINRVHFSRLGWDAAIETGFEVCKNLGASAGVLTDCYTRALQAGYPATPKEGTYSATHAALSCYYSGNFVRGAQLGYVAKVLGTSAAMPVAEKKTDRRSTAISMFINE